MRTTLIFTVLLALTAGHAYATNLAEEHHRFEQELRVLGFMIDTLVLDYRNLPHPAQAADPDQQNVFSRNLGDYPLIVGSYEDRDDTSLDPASIAFGQPFFEHHPRHRFSNQLVSGPTRRHSLEIEIFDGFRVVISPIPARARGLERGRHFELWPR